MAAAAVTVASVGALPAESVVAGPECPLAAPPVTEGQDVTGLTVVKGTTPEEFTGEIVGVINDGIAPGLDMIVARLSSTEIDRVGGIWAGISGSPVYDLEGNLIGAASHGLSFGPSPVAGITPAADMQKLLDSAPTSAQARSTLRQIQQSDKVAIPRTMARELVSSGTARSTEVAGGLERLPVPLGVSGMANTKRLRQAARALDMDNTRVYRAGSATAADGAPIDIVAGGNLAASLSYGDVTAVGVGTATAVCGNEVLAFGHPMNFTGPSTLTMHGASTLHIQEDPVFTPYKLANPSGPVGTITDDRRAAIRGVLGAAPATTDITSFVSMVGGTSRKGITKISVPAALPDIGAFHLLANHDRVFDGIGKGSAAVSWTVRGKRGNGEPFTFTRSDRFASRDDVAFMPTIDLFDHLWRLRNVETEDVKVTSVITRSSLSQEYKAFTIAGVQVRTRGRWQPLRPNRLLVLRAGTTKTFRVTLRSFQNQIGTRRVIVKLPVPARVAGKEGFLDIVGGNTDFFGGEEFFFDSGQQPSSTLTDTIRDIVRAPRNDHVLADLNLFRRNGSVMNREVRTRAPEVVNGGITLQVFVVR